MSDPAIEAAQRVVGERQWLSYGIDCAREALKPIRELHNPYEGVKLIYSTEELES